LKGEYGLISRSFGYAHVNSYTQQPIQVPIITQKADMGSMHAVLGEKSVGEAMDVQDSTGLVAGRLGLVFA